MKSFAKVAIAIAAFAATSVAFAASGASGYAGAATSGGSGAVSGVVGTGIAVEHTENSGSAYAGAGAVVRHASVLVQTTGGSESNTVSAGFRAGSAVGATGGVVGNTFSAAAHGGFGVFHW